MKRSIVYLAALFVSVFLTSCFQDIDNEAMELPYQERFESPFNISGNATFYKIHENITELVENHKIGGWDLAFQSAKAGDFVLINYTTSAQVIKTGTEIFSEVDKSLADKLFNSDQWKFNDPSFSNVKDSLALKDWENKEVYILNRGAAFPAEESFYKIQFVSKTETSYTFKYAHIESAEAIEKTVERSPVYVNQYFSFETGELASFEPIIDNWHFFFSPYIGWYETLTAGVYSPYNVKGVMINNEGGVRVAKIDDENIVYEDISLSDAQAMEFTDFKGVIGSNWKKIPTTENPVYEMDTDKKYIFKLNDGNYYKMRFLDYYSSDTGEQGFTSFEMLLLN